MKENEDVADNKDVCIFGLWIPSPQEAAFHRYEVKLIENKIEVPEIKATEDFNLREYFNLGKEPIRFKVYGYDRKLNRRKAESFERLCERRPSRSNPDKVNTDDKIETLAEF